jgi:hypothetical protein
MMRKLAIGLAAAAIAIGGSTLSTSADSYKGHYKGHLGKSIGKSHAHRFGPRTYGMEEREYGPRHREFERREFERHGYERRGYEPMLSRGERERLRSRIISRLEREPLLTPYEKDRLRGRMASRLEREGYRPYRYERERYAYRHPMYGRRYEHPYGYERGYERPHGYRYGYERRHGYRYGHEYGPEYYGRR